MTPQIINELKVKAIKRRIKCRLQDVKALLSSNKDYAIDPKTGFYWTINK